MWPWRPSTIDLDVYRVAVQDMLHGRNIYDTRSPGWNLTFIYPPIAAILMVPLAFGPYWMWQLIWTAATVAAQQAVLRRCGAPRGWRLGVIGAGLVLAMEPIRTTLGYGQVNTLLMFLVVADLLPDRDGIRRHPRGMLIGLAAAIKLTPALFLVFAFLAGRRRLALTGVASFVGYTVLGFIFQPARSWEFWTVLATGDTRAPSGPIYVGNQSILGVFARLLGEGRALTLLGLAISGLVALLAAVVATVWFVRPYGRPRLVGDQAFAVGLVGLATCLASPLSWTHHHVWAVPLGIGLMLPNTVPTWARRLGLFWVLWIAACLPLALLPYGDRREANYTWWQELIGNLGPVCGIVLIVGLALTCLSPSRIRKILRSALQVPRSPKNDNGRLTDVPNAETRASAS